MTAILAVLNQRKTMDNTGKPFERLAEALFGGVTVADINASILIRRNVILQGKSAAHEIDIFWTHSIGTISHDVAIQAKDWKRPVPLGEVAKFRAVLDDLPNRPRGIMVSRAGFQRGAVGYAGENGISLFTIREYPKKHPQLEVTTTSLTMLSVTPRPVPVVSAATQLSVETSHDMFIEHDIWFAEAMRLKIHGGGPIVSHHEHPSTLLIVGANVPQSWRVADLIQECLREARDLETWSGTRLFAPHVTLETAAGQVLTTGIRAIEVAFKIRHQHGSHLIGKPDLADYVLRNVFSGEERVIRVSSSARSAGPAQ